MGSWRGLGVSLQPAVPSKHCELLFSDQLHEQSSNGLGPIADDEGVRPLTFPQRPDEVYLTVPEVSVARFGLAL